MDTITQLLEAYLSPKSTIVTDMFAISGLDKAFASIVNCCKAKPIDLQNDELLDAMHAHRLNMGYAAMLSGICLSHAGLGIVHGYASVIGAQFVVPHGVICANLLAPATQVNVNAMRARMPNHPALSKLSQVAQLIQPDIANENEAIETLIQWLFMIVDDFKIPTLGHYGVQLSDIEAMAKTLSQKCSPIDLTEDEVIYVAKQRL